MRYILDQLHTELVQVLGSQQSIASSKTTIVSDIFGGVLQSDVSTNIHAKLRKYACEAIKNVNFLSNTVWAV